MRARNSIWTAILLGTGLVAAGCSGGGSTGEGGAEAVRADSPARQGAFQYAMARFAEKNYLGAAFQLEKVVAADPGDVEAYRYLVRAYTMAGGIHPDYFDRALEAVAKLHQLLPEDDTELIVDEAFLKRRMWQVDDALVLYEDLLANNPENCEFWVLLGDGIRDKGVEVREELGEAAESAKLDEALMAYGQAIELCPDNLAAQHGIGVILTQRKQYQDVVNMFEELHAQYPENVDFLREYAMALFRARDWEGAAPVLALLLERDPRHQERLIYSSILRKLDRLDEALAQEEIYHQTAPKLQGPRQRTGKERLQEALDLDPLLKEAADEFEAKRYADAVETWTQALERTQASLDDPEHGAAARDLVVWLERRIRYARDLAGSSSGGD